jgi:hypothetical protein
MGTLLAFRGAVALAGRGAAHEVQCGERAARPE